MSSSQSALNKLFVAIVKTIDRRVRWDRFPTPLALVMLKGIRDNLRWNNLFDTNDAASTPTLPAPSAADLVGRTADGADNDLAAPAMGMAGTRFGRNVPLALAEPETGERLLTPNPRLVSTRLLARGAEMIPAPSLNVIAAAWIQFQTRDWLSHGTDTERSFRVPRPDGDPWPDPELVVPRTQRDPDAVGDMAGTFVNTESHWWDASQIYGSTKEFREAVRRADLGPGKLAIGADGLIDARPRAARQLRRARRLVGRASSCCTLSLCASTMRSATRCSRVSVAGRDDELFAARGWSIAALIAKIHTVEWTPAILAHPALDRHARQLVRARRRSACARLLGRLSDSEVISGIPGSATDHHSAPYAITEEFVSVYRLHPLIPRRADVAFGGPTPRRRSIVGSSTLRGLRVP